MPSIFSRARTTSTTNKNASSKAQPQLDVPDEFGRVNSRSSIGVKAFTTSKKERQRTKSHSDQQQRKHGGVGGEDELDGDVVEDGFLPTGMAPPEEPQQLYGYLSYERHVVLGIEDVTRLVEIIADELNVRGVTTPFLFSNTAFDLSPPTIRRVIQAFLSNSNFAEECRFASPQDLGMVLRWGLARVVRIMNGQEVRGLLSWDGYLAWRGSEQASNYPTTDFTRFILVLPVPVRSLLLTIFTLLTRLVAHSTTTGLTPGTLASLFGPLFFGLGHLSMAFHYAYSAYLRSAHAVEHLLLAFIRLQDAQASASTPIPSRLKSWIKGYPLMLASEDRFDKPRKGVKMIRVSTVRRNVRMYTPDLVRTCASWSREPPDTGSLRMSKEWERITSAGADPNLPKQPPRYSDSYRKKMDLPLSVHPEFGPGTSSLSTTSSTHSSTSTSSTLVDDKEFGFGFRDGENRFKSLTDLKWGEFEQLGFSDSDHKKLEFDLTEGERNARAMKRTTLTWTDFSSAGFMRDEPSLSTTLQFDTSLTSSMTDWPAQAAEMHRKLKKTQKGMPSFGWDTSPVMAAEELMEEGFMDAFCDLVYGSGWMDRAEMTFRDCNWALVEFKALPVSQNSLIASGDPRSSTLVLLFEEFVPYEYRVQLASQGSKPSIRKRMPSFFSQSKSKQWKPAATLNGRPYVIGSVPGSPSPREMEFEAMLRTGGGVTKVITLDQASKSQTQLKVQNPTKAPPKPKASGKDKRLPVIITASRPPMPQLPLPVKPESPMLPPLPTVLAQVAETDSAPNTPSGRKPRFRMPGVGQSVNRRGMIEPSQYDQVEFETRLASYSDDELNGGEGRSSREKSRREKRMSKDDAWVDIMVASQGSRMKGQDAEMKPRGGHDKAIGGGRSDPELASQEIAQVLAAVQHNLPTDDEADGMDVPVDDDEDVVVPIMKPKTLGYFDIHPERRRVSQDSTVTVPDPAVAGVDGPQYLDIPPEPDVPPPIPPRVSMDSFYSEDDSESQHGEDWVRRSDGDIEVPAFPEDEPQPFIPESGHARADSATLPLNIPGPPGPTPTALSKTAALVELYNQKEKEKVQVPVPVPMIASPQPSRGPMTVPIRQLPLPPLRAAPTSTPSVPVDVESIDEEATPTPFHPGIPAVATDSQYHRASPLRYIHGAPLHNVIEEEDE